MKVGPERLTVRFNEDQQAPSAGHDGPRLAVVFRNVTRQQWIDVHEVRFEARGIGEDDRNRL